MHKDVTVSKLSKLQKRVLIYARQQMLAKEQKIDPPTQVTVCMRAPLWLDKALSEAMRRITKARKGYFLNRETFLTALHPWMRPFAEMAFLREQIAGAAKDAGVETKVNLTALHTLGQPFEFMIRLLSFEQQRRYHPWPYIDGSGWYFKMDIVGASLDQVKAELLKDDTTGVWAYDDGGAPVNCTIPEMLRDLFDFPVQDGGHIVALAFSVEQIGASRYNAAQASLRRACERLKARGLSFTRSGQFEGSVTIFSHDVYNRSRIGLTEAGIAVADALLRADVHTARADLSLPDETVAAAEAANA